MHPASSLILFTVLSGAGYGLLIVFGLAAAMGAAPADPWLGGLGVGGALLLVSAGLLASTAHLGHPERAWRALSQWRSSWLSREGVAAGATYVPALAFGLFWISGHGPLALLGLLTALCAVATILCTAMIYASLKPIARWHTRWVPAGFLGLALATGSAWAWLIWACTTGPGDTLVTLSGVTAIAAWATKALYWRATDELRSPADAGSATGLGRFGRVRLVEPPHFGENYLMREMGFRVARKHAAKLRLIALSSGGVVPVLSAVMALALPAPFGPALAALAVAGAMLGAIVERWLFFAEARHTVTLYYGAEAA